MIKFLFFLCLNIAITVFFSCEKESVTMSDNGTVKLATTTVKDTTTVKTTKISFSTEIIPILTSNCQSCHSSGSSFSCAKNDVYATINKTKFINESSPESSGLFSKPYSGHADGYLTATEHAKIVKWIEEGANNN